MGAKSKKQRIGTYLKEAGSAWNRNYVNLAYIDQHFRYRAADDKTKKIKVRYWNNWSAIVKTLTQVGGLGEGDNEMLEDKERGQITDYVNNNKDHCRHSAQGAVIVANRSRHRGEELQSFSELTHRLTSISNTSTLLGVHLVCNPRAFLGGMRSARDTCCCIPWRSFGLTSIVGVMLLVLELFSFLFGWRCLLSVISNNPTPPPSLDKMPSVNESYDVTTKCRCCVLKQFQLAL